MLLSWALKGGCRGARIPSKGREIFLKSKRNIVTVHAEVCPLDDEVGLFSPLRQPFVLVIYLIGQ